MDKNWVIVSETSTDLYFYKGVKGWEPVPPGLHSFGTVAQSASFSSKETAEDRIIRKGIWAMGTRVYATTLEAAIKRRNEIQHDVRDKQWKSFWNGENRVNDQLDSSKRI
jgi:hypothetical protein